MKAKYINPFTNFGFKRIFVEEASKPLLIDFLNALLPETIVEVSFNVNDYLKRPFDCCKYQYDVVCTKPNSETFVVELQKAELNFFTSRANYYSTFPIREQADKGQWDFNLKAVYRVGILDFTFEDYENEPERNEVVHTIKLKNQNGKIFYDKLTYIYLEMPNFKKTEATLDTRLDKWLYFIKNLEDFQSIPVIFKEEVFTQAFQKAELANLQPAEMDSYEASLKVFRDLNNTYDYAVQTAREEGLSQGKAEGLEKGKAEGKTEVAKALKESGLPTALIAKATGLSQEEINRL